MERNAPFFTFAEQTFLTLREGLGEDRALAFLRAIFARGLGAAYDRAGFQRGSTQDFARVVGERDGALGLAVSFPVVTPDKLVYRFHTDPFPGLRGQVAPERLDATYLPFKVQHLLEPGWTWETTRHLWRGDPCTEHVLQRMRA
ncbi:MAG: hypothetical protein HY520_04265 [Candidatus Aenigmarchaeota archaeon]|nr:hypothetical protein [Candidatus Aenigmarchaeota archaeon]